MSEAVEPVHEYDVEWFRQRGIDDERVIATIGAVPRRPFTMLGGVDSSTLPVSPLPPVEVVGKLLSALQIKEGDKILEIGTDTGYITTLLAHLGDHIYSVERRLPVAKLAEGRLHELGIDNVEILFGPRLTEYVLNAPYDAILLSAVAPRVPRKLKSRLAIGGRMVVPVAEGDKNPEVICIRRIDEDTFERESLGQLRFSSKLGDILVEMGIADRDDIELAALEADARGQRLGEALLEYSHVQERDLVRALAIQRGFKLASVDELLKIADHELAYSVPRAFLDHHQIVPLVIRDGELNVATVDPDAPTVELARILDADSVESYLVTGDEFHRIWNTVLEGRRRREIPGDSIKGRVEAKFEKILRVATRLQATKIHIENRPDGGQVRFRIGETLRAVPEMAFEVAEVAYLVEFLKMGSKLDVLEERLPQRGRFSWVREPVTYHLSVHVMPSIMGEQLAVQLLSHGAEAPTLESLGFPPEKIEAIDELLDLRQGLFLIVGPRHTAKKETLYAILARLAAKEDVKVGSIEEDILCPVPQIHQLLLHPEENFGYQEAIQEFVRFDIDVLGLDELPSPMMAAEAINTGRRGLMLVATLHGRDAGHVLEGLREFGLPADAMASGINAILTQRLAPKICNHCREMIAVEEDQLRALFPQGLPMGFKAYRGAGCKECAQTGVNGRMPVVELMPLDDDLRLAVMLEQSGENLRDIAAENGVEMLSEHAVRLVMEGQIPFDELINYVSVDLS